MASALGVGERCLKRAWIARGFLLVSPLLVAALAEGVARLIWGMPPSPRIFQPLSDAEGDPCRDSQGRRYWSNDPKVGQFLSENPGRRFFTKEKDPSITRIFCLGASTTYGLGYAPFASFARFLQSRLEVLSAKTVEVINAGISGYDSHSLTRVIDELWEFEPDIVVLYAGHNELKYPHLAQLRDPSASHMARWMAQSALLRRLLPKERAAAALPAVVEKQAFLGPEVLARANEGWRRFLQDTEAASRERGVGLILCTPASNVRDKAPRLTVLPDSKSEQCDWLVQFWQRWAPEDGGVSRAIPADSPESRTAAKSLASFLQEFPKASLARFLEGRFLLAFGQDQEARAAFAASLSSDGLPERAPPSFGQIVRDVCHQGTAQLADCETRIARESEHQVPGRDLFFDYCHPNLRGHWLLADEILGTLVESEWLGSSSEFAWEREGTNPEGFHVERLQISEQQFALARLERAQGSVGEYLAEPSTREGYLDIAQEMFHVALRMDPDLVRARLGLALIAALRSEREPALRWIRESEALDPEECRTYATTMASHQVLRSAFESIQVGVGSEGFQPR